MATIECIGSSCLLTQMRSKNSILLADPQMAADALEAWIPSLSNELNAEFGLAFLPNRNNRELRYGISEDTTNEFLLHPLYKVKRFPDIAILSSLVQKTIASSEIADARFLESEVEVFVYDNIFSICEWRIQLPEDFLITSLQAPAQVEKLIHEISCEVTRWLTEKNFFDQVEDALKRLSQDSESSFKGMRYWLESEKKQSVLARFKSAFSPSKQNTEINHQAKLALLWTSRLYLIPENYHSVTVPISGFLSESQKTISLPDGAKLIASWGTSAVEGSLSPAKLSELLAIRRSLQFLYATVNNYNQKIGNLYYRSLMRFTKITKQVETNIIQTKNHLGQIQLIYGDVQAGLQGWKREVFCSFLHIWSFDDHLAATVSKVNLAGDVVHASQERIRLAVQKQIRKILAIFGSLEGIAVISHLTEVAHAEHYEPDHWWGLLHFLSHVEPDVIVTVTTVTIIGLLLIFLSTGGEMEHE